MATPDDFGDIWTNNSHAVAVHGSGGSKGISGVSTVRFHKPLEDLMEDALKLKFLKVSAMPPFL